MSTSRSRPHHHDRRACRSPWRTTFEIDSETSISGREPPRAAGGRSRGRGDPGQAIESTGSARAAPDGPNGPGPCASSARRVRGSGTSHARPFGAALQPCPFYAHIGLLGHEWVSALELRSRSPGGRGSACNLRTLEAVKMGRVAMERSR